MNSLVNAVYPLREFLLRNRLSKYSSIFRKNRRIGVLSNLTCFSSRNIPASPWKIIFPVILIRSMKKKILSRDNQGKSANEIKKFIILVIVRHNLEFRGPYKMCLRDSRSRHFALQIVFFFNFCMPFRIKVMPVKNRNIFYRKNRWSLNFSARCIWKIYEHIWYQIWTYTILYYGDAGVDFLPT